MGGFLGIGGSAAKTDRKEQLAGYGDLSNVFNAGLSQSTALSGAGSSNLNSASSYWQSLLSGNRAATQAAAAPAINSTLASADASKRQASAMGTARGGGTAGANQQINDKSQATIDNALFQVRPEAAKEVGQIGNAETADALNALGISGNASSSLTDIASGSRATSNAITNQTIGQISSVLGGILGGIGL